MQATSCSTNSDFDIRFIITTVNNVPYPFTPDECTTICAVFDYLSELIDAPSGQKAVVEISKYPLMASKVAGLGTTYLPNECGLGHSAMHRVLISGLYFSEERHGVIRINLNLPFYTGDAGSIPNNQLDLYSVVLHEALMYWALLPVLA